MNIENEEKLIEKIENKPFIEIKDIIENNQINVMKLNYFQETIFYLIINEYYIDVIKLFIEKRQQYNIDNTEILFFCIECFYFEVAKLLIKYGTPIQSKNKDSKNIIQYLIEKN